MSSLTGETAEPLPLPGGKPSQQHTPATMDAETHSTAATASGGSGRASLHNSEDVEKSAAVMDDKAHGQSSGKEERSEGEQQLHTWNGPDDPDHPANWPLWRKLCTTGMFVLITFSISINSAMFAPAAPLVAAEFGVSQEVAILGTSLYLMGFGFGPPFWGPISEKFGRKTPMLIGSGGAALFSLMPALGRNMATILIGRFLSGCFGASPATIVSGAATDNWGPVGRGINLTVAVGSIFAGPLLGPVVGGFIVAHVTWRWTMYLMIIFGGAVTAFCAVFLSETFPPILLKRRAARLRKDTGDQSIVAALDVEKTNLTVIKNIYLIRPWRLFATEPILVLVTIYQAFIYGIVYLFTSAYPFAFSQDRHWATGIASLPILSLHVGIGIAIGIAVWFVRNYFAPRVAAAGGAVVPEDRLPLMIFGGVLFPAGLFWFAWTAPDPNVHWAAPAVAGIVIGCGMFSVFIQCIAYLIEVYLPVANSAMASNGLVRSLFGAGFPLFAPIMYSRLGVAWATSTLGFIALAMIPIPVVFFVFGARIRSWSKNSAVNAGK